MSKSAQKIRDDVAHTWLHVVEMLLFELCFHMKRPNFTTGEYPGDGNPLCVKISVENQK